MSASRLNKSKTRLTYQNCPSTEILHKGYKRKLTQTQYIKHFPKLKIRLNDRSNNTILAKNQSNEQQFLSEIESMRMQNKRLEEDNQQLMVKVRKQSKFNEIYEKKIDNCDIQTLPFQKIMEVKLLLEVEELQQLLNKKQEELIKVQKEMKKKKQISQNDTNDLFAELYAILLGSQKQVNQVKDSKQKQLVRLNQKLINLSQQRSKLKGFQKSKIQQCNLIKNDIDTQRLKLPSKPIITQQFPDVTSIGISRTKNIEDLQYQISKIQGQFKQNEIKIQVYMDIKVKQKLKILLQIQEISSKMKKLGSNKGRTLKQICW